MQIQTTESSETNGTGNVSQIPRVLLVESSKWSVVAMLAVRLAKAGVNVSAVCAAQHPLHRTRAVRRTFSYGALRPLESLRTAIEAVNPDIIIPCDDRAVGHLHELHSRASLMGGSSRRIAAVIEKSLGPSNSYAVVSSRYDLLRIAREEGLRVPDTAAIGSESDLMAWQRGRDFPWVLKADTTGNGQGVRFVRTSSEGTPFLKELTRFYSLGRAVRQLWRHRDPFWLRPWWRGVKPGVIAQAHIHGRPANCGVVCWRGKVLAGMGVEVFSETEAMAHASVVRVVDNPDMMRCAERIARRLNLSGFFGLDFMIEEKTGSTWLVEMNPRPTRLSALRLGEGRDQIGMLYSELSGRPVQGAEPVTQSELIAYFPEVTEPGGEVPDSCYHDIPLGEPNLIEELRNPWPNKTAFRRLIRATKRAKSFVWHLYRQKTAMNRVQTLEANHSAIPRKVQD